MRSQAKKTQILLNIIFIILSTIVVLPFLMMVSVSLSDEKDIMEYGYRLIPKRIDFSAYEYVFKNPKSVLDAYKVTAIFSFLSMLLGTFAMSALAFALSKPNLKGKRGLSFYVYFTMLFSGGLVPSYILITNYLHLADTIWVYVLPGLINPWHVFMIRTFFQGLPNEMMEAAKIDGASQYRIFLQFALPLSKPVLATVALFTFLARWNDWQTSMLYITEDSLISLQYMLQRIMNNLAMLQDETISSMGALDFVDIPSETARMAMAIVVAGPALLVFPFFQKYFVKGMTVGSVKG